MEKPICKDCNLKPCMSNGKGTFKPRCSYCHRLKFPKKVHIYRLQKKELCEECGFKPIHPCQLDVDHIDGDHTNNEPSNLKTLCANCHRLKTFLAEDSVPNGQSPLIGEY